MTDLNTVPGPAPAIYARLFTFSISLEGEDWFFTASAFATSENQALERIEDRFGKKIAQWRPRGTRKEPTPTET